MFTVGGQQWRSSTLSSEEGNKQAKMSLDATFFLKFSDDLGKLNGRDRVSVHMFWEAEKLFCDDLRCKCEY